VGTGYGEPLIEFLSDRLIAEQTILALATAEVGSA